MAKISKEEQARREGMAYALRIAKEKGVDGLEHEIKMRALPTARLELIGSWQNNTSKRSNSTRLTRC